jgi:hypothetical protein
MRMSRRLLLSVTIVLGLFALAWAGNSTRDARDLPQGSTVTVEGTVLSPSGAFAPNDNGFAIQDSNAGLYVHDALGGDYAPGQRVRVTGTLENNFGGVLGVAPTSIEVIGSHPVPTPKKRDTGEISEDTEGLLVVVEGTVTDAVFDDAPYGWIFHVDDGSGEITIFVYTGTGIDVSGIGPGTELRVTGVSAQFLDHYEIDPRFQSDLEILE